MVLEMAADPSPEAALAKAQALGVPLAVRAVVAWGLRLVGPAASIEHRHHRRKR